ncbi:MAG TPA: peptidylprolyl isomerase [Candidatus Saccharimonadales bacterium]|nr:peptidylprolyl isomerase [Candidatus Saccharimonadales bacterium]
MGQLPAINRVLDFIEAAALLVWQALKITAEVFWRFVGWLWSELKIRLPFARALAARHLNNPATLIEDVALLVLGLYVLFGLIGYGLVYQARSESRFAENLSILYPLPAARVNHGYIWDHQYLERLRFLTTFAKQAPANAKPPTDHQLRTQLMDELIQEKVIVAEAEKLKVSVTSQELMAAYAEQKKQTPDFEKKLKQLYGMSPSQFQDILANQLLKAKVENNQIIRVHVRHILVTTPQAAAAAESALKGGTSFADAAKQFSQDAQTKDKGGDLGIWAKGELAAQIAQNFEDAAFSLPVNQLSDPIQTKFGYHIIQVTEKTGEKPLSFNDWYIAALKSYSIKTYIPL